MKIRKGRLSDLNEIHKMLNESEELHGTENKEEYPKYRIRETLKDKIESVLVAEENKKLVGFLIAEVWRKKRYSYISNIFVKPDYRKKGVASELIKNHEDNCKKLGINGIFALVLVNNKKMQSFMKKYNYKKGKEFLYYEKELKK